MNRREKRKKFKYFIIIIIAIILIAGASVLSYYLHKNIQLKLNGDKEIKLSCNENYQELGATINLFTKDDSEKIEISSNVDTSKVGKYQVTYTYKYNVIRRKIVRNITVLDDEAPKITLKGNSEMHITSGTKYTDPGYDIEDNCDNVDDLEVLVEGTVEDKIGTYEITYTAKDKNGNETKVIRKVIVDAPKSSTNVTKPTYINGILIVNKTYALPSTYNPGVNSEAYSHLQDLQAKGKELGYSYTLCSGFRSYSTQKSLYNSYVAKRGQALADTFSARPGHSEHQTGIAFDIGKVEDSWANTNDYKWLKAHAHEYGFIIRYPEGKQNITGYKFEPWHVRYLGIETATKVYQSGKTLEEYLGVTSKYGD